MKLLPSQQLMVYQETTKHIKAARESERERICTLLEALTSEPVFDVEGNPLEAVPSYDLDLLISKLRDGSL